MADGPKRVKAPNMGSSLSRAFKQVFGGAGKQAGKAMGQGLMGGALVKPKSGPKRVKPRK